MTRATVCLALYLTLIVSVAHGMTGGDGWPMIAASLLCLVAPSALRRR